VSEDDWFERVLRDSTDSDGTDGTDEADEADGADGTDEADGTDGVGPAEADAAAPTGDPGNGERPAEPGEAGEAGPLDEDPFGRDFASALEDAPAPEGVGDDGGTEFDDFGFGLGGGGTEFDEESFESDIERLEIGIEGLDEMILGGVPRRSLMVAVGSAGTGKTTFGLQFLRRALVDGDRAVYITLEESRERIVETADEKGWGFSTHVANDDLAVVDLDPVEMANSLASIRNELPRLVDDFDADRLVLDSVSLLEMMYDHPATRRSEVFDFTRSLKDAGVSMLFTSEASAEDAYTSRYGLIEYLADAVFVLQYVRPSDFRETRLAVEIQKIRDANHSRETKPYEITDEGISVYQQANIF
jgi:KaiC domain protein